MQMNARAAHDADISPHYKSVGSKPELATLMPCGSVVAVENNLVHAEIDGRGLVGVCLGLDPRFGRGAISVLIGGQERHARTFKFIEAPGAAIEPVPDLINPTAC